MKGKQMEFLSCLHNQVADTRVVKMHCVQQFGYKGCYEW